MDMVQKHKKYLGATLIVAAFGIIAVPGITGAATANTTINSSIGSTISVTSSGTVTANVTPTSSGAQTIAEDTVAVSTNNTTGYTLQVSDSDTTTTLVSGSNSIPAASGTVGSPVAQTVNTWGFRVDGLGGFGAGPTSAQSSAAIGSIKFAGMPASTSPVTIKTTSTTAASDQTSVWYGVAANTSQPAGSYSGQVTYTATAN
jgi:hypothetical protein